MIVSTTQFSKYCSNESKKIDTQEKKYTIYKIMSSKSHQKAPEKSSKSFQSSLKFWKSSKFSKPSIATTKEVLKLGLPIGLGIFIELSKCLFKTIAKQH